MKCRERKGEEVSEGERGKREKMDDLAIIVNGGLGVKRCGLFVSGCMQYCVQLKPLH